MPQPAPEAMPATVWTIGHSTRPLEEFLGLLRTYGIEAVADVRRFPGSRRYPHFARDALGESLRAHDIEYRWLPQWGGRRKARADSPNSAWRNAAFRGYADHLASAEFAEGLQELRSPPSQAHHTDVRGALWRCHRALIADVRSVRGIKVVHIIDATHSVVHSMTAPARVVQGELTYILAAAE